MLFSNFHYHSKPINFNEPVIAFLRILRNDYAFNKEEGVCVTGYEHEIIQQDVSPFVIKIKIDDTLNVKCLSSDFEKAYNDFIRKNQETAQFKDVDDFLTKTIRMSLNGTPIAIDKYTISYQIENESILPLLKKASGFVYCLDKDGEFTDEIISEANSLEREITNNLSMNIIMRKYNKKPMENHLGSRIKQALYLAQERSCIFNPTISLSDEIFNAATPIIEELLAQEAKDEEKDESQMSADEIKQLQIESSIRTNEAKKRVVEIIIEKMNNAQSLKDNLIYSKKIQFEPTILQTAEQQRNANRLKQALFA